MLDGQDQELTYECDSSPARTGAIVLLPQADGMEALRTAPGIEQWAPKAVVPIRDGSRAKTGQWIREHL